MEKIDVFAHVLLPNYYEKMLNVDSTISSTYAFTNIESLKDLSVRRKLWNGITKQIVSYANINAEDYCNREDAAKLCREANVELINSVRENNDMFPYGIGMLPFNNIEESLHILDEIAHSKELVGIQVFTRHLGKSIASKEYLPILKKCARLGLLVLLHPVFDPRKPDNNIVFSWEYELSLAMLDLVNADIFTECPNIKIIVHHAGAMVPYFAGRIDNIMQDKKEEFKKFYVDTAILGNSKALELAVNYFGIDNVLYGTDAPFGIMPNGATKEIEDAISELPLSLEEKEKIYSKNIQKLLEKKEGKNR